MLLTNHLATYFSTVCARQVLLQAQNVDDELPRMYKATQNKQLKEKEAAVLLDGVSIKFDEVEEAVKALEFFRGTESVLGNLNEITEELKTKSRSFEGDLRTGVFSFVVFFSDSPSNLKRIQELNGQNDFKIMISTDKAAAKKLGASFPGIVAYNARDRNCSAMDFPSDLKTLAAEITLSSFEKISAENIRLFQTYPKKMLYFITREEIDYDEAFRKYQPEAVKAAKECKVIFFRPEDVPVLDKLLHLENEEYPVMLHMDESSKHVVKRVTPGNFADSVQRLLKGKGERTTFRSVIPEDNKDRLVRVANTDTLSGIRADKSVDRLFVFSNPSCGHCKQLMPVVEALSKILANKKVKIEFYNYNVVENEQIADIAVPTVPKLFFKKQGSVEMVNIDSLRDIPSLLKHISENGVSSKVNLDDYKEHLPKESTKESEKEKESDDDEEKIKKDEKESEKEGKKEGEKEGEKQREAL
ncbi:PDI1 [Enterospora canceri]|uniref:protein disulfide-isomerase n=1 Tax=Enterospora canceri TaxID=1081671 RepID=A0A1Y1S8D6_9MICR|nr:PDI1 [Enterospora canceri]